MRNSTSITQNLPVPSFVVFGADTDRSTWEFEITSPGRTGSWNTIVLSVITTASAARRSP